MKWLLLTTSLISSLQSSDACSASKDATAPPDGQQKDQGAPPNGNVTGPAVNPNNPTQNPLITSPGQTPTQVRGIGTGPVVNSSTGGTMSCADTCLGDCGVGGPLARQFLDQCGPSEKLLDGKPDLCCNGTLSDGKDISIMFKCHGQYQYRICGVDLVNNRLKEYARLSSCTSALKKKDEKTQAIKCKGIHYSYCYNASTCLVE